jgi:hypothetical protein
MDDGEWYIPSATGLEKIVYTFGVGLEKFAELIVRECARLNRLQSYELMGVITDVEEGDGFDDVCLNTVKRVAEHLANDLKEHFGVEE